MQTFSEQTRCQNQIPDDARTGQDELNLSGSNWTCPNVVPAKCKEINQGSAPSPPSHHHIVFNLQKPCVFKVMSKHLKLVNEKLVLCLAGQKCWGCFLMIGQDLIHSWIVCYDASLDVWCTSGAKKHPEDSWKNLGTWVRSDIHLLSRIFLLVVSTNLEVQTIKKLKYFLKYKDASVDQVSAQRSILFTPAGIITSLIFLNEYSLNDYFELNFATTVAPRMGRVESGRKL